MVDQINYRNSLIVPETGEVVQDYGRIVDRVISGREEFIESIFGDNGRKPLHLKIAERFNVTPSEVQSYCGVIPVKASEMKDKILTIIGFTPWFSGAFRSQKTNEIEEGFYKVLFKITDKKVRKIIVNDSVVRIEQNVIVATSGKRVATFFAQMAESYGFYDWPEGTSVRIVINKDSDTNEEEVVSVPDSIEEL